MQNKLKEFLCFLDREEKSSATRQQYHRDILLFLSYLENREITKELVIRYKEKLQRTHKITSVNTKLAALNHFFSFLDREDLKVKQLKLQRQAYCSQEKELTKGEYLRLVQTAQKQKNEKLSLLLQTICGTGIRVSELRFITVEAVQCGEAVIQLKGKTRVILLAGKLRKSLLRYAKRQGISSGPVFCSRTGHALDRWRIWKMMKMLCEEAGVEKGKVFPHNLRHLFARCFYQLDKDLAKLADVLGHSNINTTRIYIISSGQEHRRHMESLGLVV